MGTVLAAIFIGSIMHGASYSNESLSQVSLQETQQLSSDLGRKWRRVDSSSIFNDDWGLTNDGISPDLPKTLTTQDLIKMADDTAFAQEYPLSALNRVLSQRVDELEQRDQKLVDTIKIIMFDSFRSNTNLLSNKDMDKIAKEYIITLHKLDVSYDDPVIHHVCLLTSIRYCSDSLNMRVERKKRDRYKKKASEWFALISSDKLPFEAKDLYLKLKKDLLGVEDSLFPSASIFGGLL
jgi:hypothetical protein